MNTVCSKTELSKTHFVNEGERIKAQDRLAIYEIRDPEKLARDVDFGFARYDIILKLVDKHCLRREVSHLDLGCGLGYLMAKMSQRTFKTSGVDISRSFLDIAQEKLKHWNLIYENLIEADLQKYINLKDESYEVITSTDVLEHIEKPELFIGQLYRLLSPDGKAFISTNNILSLWGLEKIIKEGLLSKKCFHPIDKWFTFWSLKKLLERNGFRIIDSRGTYFFPLFRFKRILKLLGIFQKRFEINDWLSKSIFKYFGRDIILVMEKKHNPINIRISNSKIKIKKHHTPLRLINLFFSRLGFLVRLSKVIAYPTHLVVEPTNICNLRCPLCPTGQNRNGRPKGKLEFERFRRIIDEIGPYLYSLRLENWGEPLLNEQLFNMIAYAHSKKINTSFNTNLTFLNARSAKELVLSGLDHIKISLDGATKETYSKYRVGADFDKVIENIKLLVGAREAMHNKLKPLIELQFIVMKHNLAEIEKIKHLSGVLAVDGLLIEYLRPDMREELFNSDFSSIEKFKEWLPDDNRYSFFDYKKKARKRRFNVCRYLWNSVVINFDGSIAPCCSIYDPEYDFGNIFTDGFKNVWNGPKYQAARGLIGRRKELADSVVCNFCFKKGTFV